MNITIVKDSVENEIRLDDIVTVCGVGGWIWESDGELLVAWDLEGLSCEDSEPLKDLLNKKAYVKVVGTVKRKK